MYVHYQLLRFEAAFIRSWKVRTRRCRAAFSLSLSSPPSSSLFDLESQADVLVPPISSLKALLTLRLSP